jgi:hypothetical protein
MSANGNVLLLVGSAKRPRSTSESLGSYLIENFEAHGVETETTHLYRAYRSEEGRAALLAATDAADLIVLAFPLYVDCLPTLTIKALEDIATHRAMKGHRAGQRLVAIVNCGFPEADQNETALAICRQFAQEADFEWAGGLALGAGQGIDGRPLVDMGRMAGDITAALDIAAEALAKGKAIPEEAMAKMAQPMIPVWAYSIVGGINWRLQARQHGALRDLNNRPYL